MTKEEAKLVLDNARPQTKEIDRQFYDDEDLNNALDMAIKALEQEPSDDIMAIHTQGLDEGIRCAMCTNSMKSDSECDGGCVVNEDMYKKVMDTIKNQMSSRPTSDDCVSRAEALNQLKEWRDCEFVKMTNPYHYLEKRIQSMPPVTPTHGTCKDCRWLNTDEDGNYYCIQTGCFDSLDFYCADFEKRGSENEVD